MSLANQPFATSAVEGIAPAAVAAGGASPKPAERIPELRNGDRLTRSEFERRYEAMPHVNGAQLIEGIVYMPSPVRYVQHGGPHSSLITWLGLYRIKTPQVRCADNATSRLDNDNEPQPDAVLFLTSDIGGRVTVDGDGYLSGPPELVCEVSSSTVSIDLNAKLNAYRRNGVREYLVWRVEEDAIDWFELVEGRYAQLPVDESGIVRSKAFPGLWLNVPALLSDDLAAVAATVDAGAAAPEHAQFKATLEAKRQGA